MQNKTQIGIEDRDAKKGRIPEARECLPRETGKKLRRQGGVWWKTLAALLLLQLPQESHAIAPPGYQLAWFDEFESLHLDGSKWKHWLEGRRRDAVNTPGAVTIEDGFLVITTYTEGGVTYTGMISTEGLFETAYGYWEAALSFQDAPATFSDFWLHSPTIGVPHDDPTAAGVEIDIVEHREFDNDGQNIGGHSSINLHWGGYEEHHDGDGFFTANHQLSMGFHVYGLEWTEDAYKFFVDGKLVWTHHKTISRRPQFAVLSTEVEHLLWSGPVPENGYGDRKSSRTKMLVDYVRYYVKQPVFPDPKD
jgi:beta-glucanase (GH16 family)